MLLLPATPNNAVVDFSFSDTMLSGWLTDRRGGGQWTSQLGWHGRRRCYLKGNMPRLKHGVRRGLFLLQALRVQPLQHQPSVFKLSDESRECRSSDSLTGSNALLDDGPVAMSIDDFSVNLIRLALSVNVDELPEREALAITDFIERIGGRENAMLAVEMLEEVERGQL